MTGDETGLAYFNPFITHTAHALGIAFTGDKMPYSPSARGVVWLT